MSFILCLVPQGYFVSRLGSLFIHRFISCACVCVCVYTCMCVYLASGVNKNNGCNCSLTFTWKWKKTQMLHFGLRVLFIKFVVISSSSGRSVSAGLTSAFLIFRQTGPSSGTVYLGLLSRCCPRNIYEQRKDLNVVIRLNVFVFWLVTEPRGNTSSLPTHSLILTREKQTKVWKSHLANCLLPSFYSFRLLFCL